MFRRIELIRELSPAEAALLAEVEQGHEHLDVAALDRFCKSGLTGGGNDSVGFTVWDTWSTMNSPRRTINKDCRFFFTEAGWCRYGQATITACQQMGQKYRVIAIKEKSVDVLYRDEVQVAIRQRKKRQWHTIRTHRSTQQYPRNLANPFPNKG